MRVVVDTNIIFRALLSRTSPIWGTLLRTNLQDSVFAPRFLVVEIEDHWERICEKTKLPEDDLVAARDEIFRLLTFVDLEDVSVEHRRLAYDLCRDVDLKDIPFIALTLHLQALLWTNDRELKKGVLPIATLAMTGGECASAKPLPLSGSSTTAPHPRHCDVYDLCKDYFSAKVATLSEIWSGE